MPTKQSRVVPSNLFARAARGRLRYAAATLLVGAAPAAPLPPDTLVLAVASWCAPCRGELARLDEIVAAAGATEVRVLPIDRSAATAAMLRGIDPRRIWRSAAAADAVLAETGGLPFSVMTDNRGRRCAAHARPLDAAAVRAMRARCRAAS